MTACIPTPAPHIVPYTFLHHKTGSKNATLWEEVEELTPLEFPSHQERQRESGKGIVNTK